MHPTEILKQDRRLILSLTSGLSEEQWLMIPSVHGNNDS